MAVGRARDDSAALGGVINGYAPLDTNLKVPNQYINAVQAFIGAKVTSTAATAIPAGVETAIPFDTEAWDTDGFHSNVTANTRLTIPAGLGGRYFIQAQAAINVTSNSDQYAIIRKNGSGYEAYAGRAGSVAGGPTGHPVSVTLDLIPGDYVEFNLYQNSGTPTLLTTAGFTWFSIYKLDSGKVGNGIGCGAYASGTQSITTSTITPITLNTEEFDTDGFHDVGSNTSRMTIPAGLGGKYFVIGGYGWDTDTTGTRYAWVTKNGASVNGGVSSIPAANISANEVSMVLNLVPGDYIEMMAYQTSGTTRTLGNAGGDPKFRAHLEIMRFDSGSARSGMTLLEQHTASASATLDFTSFISSDYDEYIFELINLIPATNNQNFIMRMGTGSGPTYDSGSNYSWAHYQQGTGGAFNNNSGSDTGIQVIHDVNNTASYSANGSIHLFAPSSALFKNITTQGMAYSSDSNFYSNTGAGVYKSTTAITGIRFLFAAGNITSGTIRVYGLAK